MVGRENDLKGIEKGLKKKYEVKTEWLGGKSWMKKEIKVLNRKICWTEEGITYEADERHAKLIIEQLGMEGAKKTVTPG
eukprot:11445276-Karenia_brevis.AAC.1